MLISKLKMVFCYVENKNIDGFFVGSAWRIHISEATKHTLEESGGYHIECRGQTELKGKGKVMTYWLLGKVGFDKQLPTPPPIRFKYSNQYNLQICVVKLVY